MTPLEDAMPRMKVFHATDAHGTLTGFSDLVAPVGTAQFRETYMGRRPFFVKRNREGWFDALVTVDEVADLLSSTVFYDTELRVAKDGAVYPSSRIAVNGVIDRNMVWDAYAGGATLVFEHLNRKHPGILRLMGRCEQQFLIPFRANAYITPPAAKGFDLHYDTHDVLILQVSGRKLWQIHDDPLPLPHEDQPFRKELIASSQRIAEIMLEPGDVLYLPRGYLHSASTNDSLSCHVTIGIRTVPVRDVCQAAFKRAVFARPEFRPVALFRQGRPDCEDIRRQLLSMLDEIDLETAFRDSELSFGRKRSRSLDGALMEMIAPPSLEPESRMSRRDGVVYRTVEDNGRLMLHFDRKSIALPSSARPALECALSGRIFRPMDLPGMEAESRMILAKTLFDERLVCLREAA